MIAFAFGISTATGILFGVLPAWQASALKVNEALKAVSRAATAGRRAHRVQASLVISEVCLSLVLVAGAGLLTNSFWKLRSVMLKLSKGFDVWGETIRNDKYSVILETNQQEQLIFKHAISTVVVSKPLHGPMHTNAAFAASHSVRGAPVVDGDT